MRLEPPCQRDIDHHWSVVRAAEQISCSVARTAYTWTPSGIGFYGVLTAIKSALTPEEATRFKNYLRPMVHQGIDGRTRMATAYVTADRSAG